MIARYINSCNIYHRYLTPEDFLIRTEKNGRIYLHLKDFGLAKNMDQIIKKAGIEYMAPEILNASSLGKPNISKNDEWSIGVIAYKLCTLRLPFKLESLAATKEAILTAPHDPIVHKIYSDELKDIINRLLTKDPAERLSI
jgi:serine/threonine protein kinase